MIVTGIIWDPVVSHNIDSSAVIGYPKSLTIAVAGTNLRPDEGALISLRDILAGLNKNNCDGKNSKNNKKAEESQGVFWKKLFDKHFCILPYYSKASSSLRG